MEMELVLKTSRKSDKNMVKNEAFTDETILTKTDKPTKPYISNLAYLILRKKGWFLEILQFFLETINITIKITMRNVIINYKIFQVITVLSRDSSSTVTEEVSR